MRWIRKHPRLADTAAIGGSVLLFAGWFLAEWLGPTWAITHLTKEIVIVFWALMAACVVLLIYFGRQARSVRVRCAECDHDLTGRRAGACPNCGSPAERAYRHTERCRCGYNFRGNQTGRCPECGRKMHALI